MHPRIRPATCSLTDCDRDSSMQQIPHYNQSIALNSTIYVPLIQQAQHPLHASRPIALSGATETPHYKGPVTSPSSLANALGNVLSTDSTSLILKYCQWKSADDLLPCYHSPLDHEDVPSHFKTAHGIKGIGRKARIQCRWLNCNRTVVRNNFARHIREVHLGNGRRKP